jgi:hypothetical protein
VLLPFSADWRWLLHRDDSPWYPTARLYRQPALGDWPSVVTQAENAVRRFAPCEERLGDGRDEILAVNART